MRMSNFFWRGHQTKAIEGDLLKIECFMYPQYSMMLKNSLDDFIERESGKPLGLIRNGLIVEFDISNLVPMLISKNFSEIYNFYECSVSMPLMYELLNKPEKFHIMLAFRFKVLTVREPVDCDVEFSRRYVELSTATEREIPGADSISSIFPRMRAFLARNLLTELHRLWIRDCNELLKIKYS